MAEKRRRAAECSFVVENGRINYRGSISILAITKCLVFAFIIQNIALMVMVSRYHLPTSSLDSMLSLSSGGDVSTITNMHPAKTKQANKTARFAYVFLMAGCNPKKKTRYIGYVLNILISKHVLKESGSKADVIVLARMSSETEDETISEQETLEKAGVIVRYLPKVHTDNFYSAMLDKFQILKLLEYERIIFFDSDSTPHCNMDYMFHISMGPNPIFAPNVVLSYKHEPAQGGFFMLQPEEGDYERLQEIIDHRMNTYYNFSEVYGWGHKIEPPDHWNSMNEKNQTLWNWYGACEYLQVKCSLRL